MEDEIQKMKEDIILELKDDFKKSILNSFIENSDSWKNRMNAINEIILINNQNALNCPDSLYNDYNEFCKKVIEISENTLEKDIDYNLLFLTNKEYMSLLQKSEFDNEIEKTNHALFEKFTKNFHIVIVASQIRELVKHKLGEEFCFTGKDFETFNALFSGLANDLNI